MLSAYTEREGPPLKIENAVKAFREKWKGAKMTVKNGRVYATIKRKFPMAEDLLKAKFSERMKERGLAKAIKETRWRTS